MDRELQDSVWATAYGTTFSIEFDRTLDANQAALQAIAAANQAVMALRTHATPRACEQRASV